MKVEVKLQLVEASEGVPMEKVQSTVHTLIIARILHVLATGQVTSAKEMRAQETTTFEAGLADVTHAITQMEKALDSIKAMKPSLTQIKSSLILYCF